MLALAAAAAIVSPGLYTNEEQVEFARDAGQIPPPWIGILAGDDSLTRVDAYGKKLDAPLPDIAQAGPDALEARTAEGQLLTFLRARSWRCWAAIPKAGGGWWGQQDIRLHDRGGRALLETDEPTPSRFILRMRNVVFPAPPNQPSLVLYVHGEDPVRAISYAWAEPGAKRLGINLRTMQASCTLAGQEPG